jgi:hypothetical protein
MNDECNNNQMVNIIIVAQTLVWAKMVYTSKRASERPPASTTRFLLMKHINRIIHHVGTPHYTEPI